MSNIHATAVVDPKAEIGEDVEIGPFCVVGPYVKIGNGCKLISQCSVIGHTTLGEENTLYPFVSIGTNAQDYEYKGHRSYLKIGNKNVFREGFTGNCGTKPETETVIGNECFFMANSHVAHNCVVGNGVIMANDAMIAGYSNIADKAILSGLTAVHQFCSVGRMAMIGGGVAISKDLPPFMMAFTKSNTVSNLNVVGLKRSGASKETIKALKELFRIFYRSRLNVKNAMIKIEENVEKLPEVVEFIEFVKSSKRGVLAASADI
jgi:UDP-N-acetylglucosamine acyltransferase